MTNLCW